jgi:hypothetical protein
MDATGLYSKAQMNVAILHFFLFGKAHESEADSPHLIVKQELLITNKLIFAIFPDDKLGIFQISAYSNMKHTMAL